MLQLFQHRHDVNAVIVNLSEEIRNLSKELMDMDVPLDETSGKTTVVALEVKALALSVFPTAAARAEFRQQFPRPPHPKEK